MSRSPLVESIVLCLLLLSLAWPLAALTGNQRIKHYLATEAEEQKEGQYLSFAIKVHGSEQLSNVRISIAGKEVVEAREINSSDWDVEKKLPLFDGVLSIILEASFATDEQDEALKVELWPESLPEKSFTFWGTGEIFEEFEVEWESHE